MVFRYIGTTFLFCIFTFLSTTANDVIVDDDNTDDYCTNYSETNSEFEALFSRPYRSGMKGPHAFDCSGFTSYVYGTKNISLSPSSKTQYTQGVSVKRDDLRQGDLVFFTSPRSGGRVGHVGIVTEVEDNGNFHFVHASRRGVVVDSYAKAGYYQGRYIGARRILDY